MNKTELAEKLAEKAGLSKADANKAINAMFNPESGAIAEALKSGEKVSIPGFGSFETRTREARKGRNPRTGKEIDIAASTSAGFKPGKGLKDTLS